MPAILRYALQAALYAAFALVVGVFTTWPSFRLLGPDEALLRLSFLHPGQPVQACRQRTAEELAKMPPQMRAAADCPRERSAVLVRVELDGQVIVDDSFPPGGLSRDGAAAGYRSRPLPAGDHQLRVRFSDDARRRDQPYERAARIRVTPGQVVLIDFNPEQGGVVIR